MQRFFYFSKIAPRLQEVVTFRIFGVREFQNVLGIPLDEISSFLALLSWYFHSEPFETEQTYP